MCSTALAAAGLIKGFFDAGNHRQADLHLGLGQIQQLTVLGNGILARQGASAIRAPLAPEL